MKRLLVSSLAAMALAGMGHNMPPATMQITPTVQTQNGVLPRRVLDENRRNQKLKQKLRRAKRRHYRNRYTRFERKTQQFGGGYRPGKLFKGHRV